MSLMSVNDLSMSFGGPLLLNKISFQVERGQRICIVGRNGEGKSTLLRLMSGDLVPDSGNIASKKGVTVARLSQKVPEVLEGSVFEVVASGLGELGSALTRYHAVSLEVANGGDVAKLSEVEDVMERHGGWEAMTTIEMVISRLSLSPEMRFEKLSGGLKRRALLARALASKPDILLLDEPTNHLDIDSIAWLEEFIVKNIKTLIFITHDRMFLRRIATRIIELDRGNLADWSCDYDTFLKRKEDLLAAEEKNWSEFDKKLAREETWIRQGIKARRTRNEGRVRALKKLREERKLRRERTGKANIEIQNAARSGKIVAETINASFSWDGVPVFKNLNATITRGDRIGIIGPNGAGKTTLIQVLLGNLKPESGQVKLGTKLEVSYFDQHREQLDPQKSVRDSVADGNDTVTINGRDKHIMGYLKDFLFAPERANSPVSVLSGGERNRLLLARLFTRPSNLLVMDEPTNDLDAETLELLEDRIMEYPGTVIIVSHDRMFLNNVVTGTIAFEGNAEVREYVGGYDDWIRQRPQGEEKVKPKLTKVKASKPPVQQTPQKLSYKEQREYDGLKAELVELPVKIEELETAIEKIQMLMVDSDFYRKSAQEMAATQAKLEALESEHETTFERWEEVEAKLEEYRGRGSK
ncbi:ATP-binding cassette domain-containing protein [Maridesulfovibrio hydrothermalis]|uniref:ATP-binding protein Uup n=1 Tax=Maridesulfovibrio hydrothermalis AM13 = DSM 14728 TaxID=1121451 RepID=L0R833_9BACT|nr:ATP-binding cassette domain-containing protein [Maridesulfovibrio hydrothermalis]CCO22392.1 ABC transporter ATP-binding protein uup [Maridesulfovibrio hydrothermalis AM13 = DSM 14728]